jgi:hypothetical protein
VDDKGFPLDTNGAKAEMAAGSNVVDWTKVVDAEYDKVTLDKKLSGPKPTPDGTSQREVGPDKTPPNLGAIGNAVTSWAMVNKTDGTRLPPPGKYSTTARQVPYAPYLGWTAQQAKS